MATKKDNDNIGSLKTSMALVKKDIDYIKKAQDSILKRLDNLTFASQADFEELKIDHSSLKKEFQDYKDKHAVGAAFGDMFSNSAFQYVIGGILAIAAVALAKIAGVKIL